MILEKIKIKEEIMTYELKEYLNIMQGLCSVKKFINDDLESKLNDEKIQNWININEEKPSINQKILFYSENREEIISGIYVMSYSKNKMIFVDILSDFDCEEEIITHWMPLPERPY
jgi:hypothetical protein